jgi:hypothetical protein
VELAAFDALERRREGLAALTEGRRPHQGEGDG